MTLKKILCMFLLLACCAACVRAVHDERLGLPAFKPIAFNPPEPERVVLANGIIVYLLEDHELPLINVNTLIRTGSIYEPPELAGLASLAGGLMRTGGTLTMKSDDIDRQLEDMSAQVGVSIGLEQGTATLGVLTEDFDRALGIYTAILKEPAFEPEKIGIARSNTCQGLRQVLDNPQSLAFREFRKLLYAGNPRSPQPSVASVSRITRSDLLAFHKKFFQPQNMMFAVSGDFKRDEMIAKLEHYFGSWRSADSAIIPAVAPPGPPAKLAAYYLEKKIPQSTIVLGQLGPAQTDPDYFTFQLLDFIIGSGGFASRLFSQVRTDRGLAYSVGSFYRGANDYGVFGAYCMTKAGTTTQALGLMLDILKSLKQGEITAEDLSLAKEAILNNYIFYYTSSSQIAGMQAGLEFNHLPQDFFRKALDKIRLITLDDLKRVAAAWLQPDKVIILAVGDKAQFDVQPDAWQWGRAQAITSDVVREK